jgi:hypothetical protein
MLPSALLTAPADVTIDFLVDVTYDAAKILKRPLAIPLNGILIYDNIHDNTVSSRLGDSANMLLYYSESVFCRLAASTFLQVFSISPPRAFVATPVSGVRLNSEVVLVACC